MKKKKGRRRRKRRRRRRRRRRKDREEKDKKKEKEEEERKRGRRKKEEKKGEGERRRRRRNVVTHACNPSTLGGQGGGITLGHKFKTSMANMDYSTELGPVFTELRWGFLRAKLQIVIVLLDLAIQRSYQALGWYWGISAKSPGTVHDGAVACFFGTPLLTLPGAACRWAGFGGCDPMAVSRVSGEGLDSGVPSVLSFLFLNCRIGLIQSVSPTKKEEPVLVSLTFTELKKTTLYFIWNRKKSLHSHNNPKQKEQSWKHQAT
ncbi:hypothetical protein AAY473_024108 [Plecturocebus cupreus]